MDYEYLVVIRDKKQLADQLNEHAEHGWRFVPTPWTDVLVFERQR